MRVHCITVVPVLNEWTQYEVNNLNGSVQVAARKDDVNVERSGNSKKPSPETETSHGSSVHETEQKSFSESEICGAPAQPVGPTSGLNPEWIAAGGAAGVGILICVLLCGGGKTPGELIDALVSPTDSSRSQSQNSFMGVTGRHQGGQKFGDVVGATCLHGDVDGSVAEIDAVIGAVVGGLDDVGAMVGEDSGEAMQCAGIVRAGGHAQADEASIFDQATFDDAREQRNVEQGNDERRRTRT